MFGCFARQNKRKVLKQKNGNILDQPVLSDVAELSLNSVVGISTPKIMKLQGKVMGQEVVVLIDCGRGFP